MLVTTAAGADSWIVRKSTDNGATWAQVDEVLPQNERTFAQSIAQDTAGGLYAAGYSNSSQWMVRKSADQGVTWKTVGLFANPPVSVASVHAAASPSGPVFLGGPGNAYPALDAVIQKTSDGGVNWTCVDDFNYHDDSTSLVDLVIGPTGRVYSLYQAGSDRWVLRSSADGGTTWTTLSDVSPSAHTAAAQAMRVEPDGTLRVLVLLDLGRGNFRWSVSKSVDGGTSWSESGDDFTTALSAAGDLAFTVGGGGSLFVSGSATTANLQSIQTSADQGVTWSALPAPGSGSASASRLKFDGSGNLLLTGRESGNGVLYRYSFGSGTWTKLDSFQGQSHLADPYAPVPTDGCGCE